MKVLFVCFANAIRSQMAEGYARARGPRTLEVESAGLIAAGLHPRAVQAMAAIGIDISRQQSKTLASLEPAGFDVVVSLTEQARPVCDAFGAGRTRLHWPIGDPAGARGTDAELDALFAQTRDAIAARIDTFLAAPTQGPLRASARSKTTAPRGGTRR